jgi:hypothetical protein
MKYCRRSVSGLARAVFISAMILVTCAASTEATAVRDEPKPTEAISSILRAFDHHPVVAVGDLHGPNDLKRSITQSKQRPAGRRRSLKLPSFY